MEWTWNHSTNSGFQTQRFFLNRNSNQIIKIVGIPQQWKSATKIRSFIIHYYTRRIIMQQQQYLSTNTGRQWTKEEICDVFYSQKPIHYSRTKWSIFFLFFFLGGKKRLGFNLIIWKKNSVSLIYYWWELSILYGNMRQDKDLSIKDKSIVYFLDE